MNNCGLIRQVDSKHSPGTSVILRQKVKEHRTFSSMIQCFSLLLLFVDSIVSVHHEIPKERLFYMQMKYLHVCMCACIDEDNFDYFLLHHWMPPPKLLTFLLIKIIISGTTYNYIVYCSTLMDLSKF